VLYIDIHVITFDFEMTLTSTRLTAVIVVGSFLRKRANRDSIGR